MPPMDMPADPEAWDHIPEISHIRAAADRLRGLAVKTPLLESHKLNQQVGGRVLIKAENLQRTGSFKFRGAYNRISEIPEAQRAAGVLAYSSGNHAQGVAASAQLLGLPATIVMPADAPKMKIENTRGYGAQVKLYDRFGQSREEIAERIIQETGATLIRPFDDAGIIAGQGTCGLEIAEQAKALGAELDALLVCCGGGGLTSGCAIAMAALSPRTTVHTVEPLDFDDTARSLRSGQVETVSPDARSFCDALLSPSPGRVTFEILKRHCGAGLTVSDAEVRAAMVFAFEALKLVVEPGGAVCLAALLAGKWPAANKTTAITLSGGNVDAALFQQVMTA